MRLLLGGLLLVALFAGAALWQRRWTSSARSQRDLARTLGTTETSELEPGWSRVIVGRPSGGEPFRMPAGTEASASERDTARPGTRSVEPGVRSVEPDVRARESVQPAEPSAPAQPPSPSASLRLRPAQVTVESGQSLSRICAEHYGTASRELVLAVARYNRLASPDLLHEGQTLELPPIQSFIEQR